MVADLQLVFFYIVFKEDGVLCVGDGKGNFYYQWKPEPGGPVNGMTLIMVHSDEPVQHGKRLMRYLHGRYFYSSYHGFILAAIRPM